MLKKSKKIKFQLVFNKKALIYLSYQFLLLILHFYSSFSSLSSNIKAIPVI